MNRIHHKILLFLTFLACAGSSLADDIPLIRGNLVVAKVVDMEQYDAEAHPEYAHIQTLGLVQNVKAEINGVLIAEDASKLVGTQFSLTSHGVEPKSNMDELTVLGFEKNVHSRENMTLDTRIISVLVRAKNFGPSPANKEHPIQGQYPIEHFMKCPKYSIFYVLFRPLMMENEGHPGLYNAHHDWARALERFSGLEKDERVRELAKFVEGKNSLLAVHAVHLLARLYPEEVGERFKPWLLAGNLTPEARIAIDQELCIRDGEKWGKSDTRMEFATFLQELNPVTIEGTILMEFYQRAAPQWLRPEQ